MKKIKKRRLTTAEDLGLKIIVLKGPSPHAGKILFPEKVAIANMVAEKLVDEKGHPFFKKAKKKI